MGYVKFFAIVFLSWFFCISSTHQLQSYQTQVLLQLRKHLEYPLQLQIWENYNGDLCNVLPTPRLSITCEDDFITELKIMGDKLGKVSEFNGFAVPNQTLSQSFSIDSFVVTLTRLTSLRVISLVSLGIWGPLPEKIHRLSSLELLDMSSNFIFGAIPPQLSRLVKLHTLTLDSNFFNDTAPNWLDSLSNLTILSLKNNQLKGHFPSSLCKITKLTDIALSHNELSGKLPDLSTLTSLHLLDLRENHLDSELPLMPEGLATVLLSKNSFSGKIPEQFGKLNQLQHLDLSFNHLRETPPSALFSLPNISYLNLASNRLSGTLSNHLSCGAELGYVDISSNRLIGALPPCLLSSHDNRVVKFGGNCLSIDTQHQHQESYCNEGNTRRKGKDIGVLVGVIGGTVILLILLAFGLLILYRKNFSQGILEQRSSQKVVQDNSQSGISSELLANARLISQAVKFGAQSAPAYRLFSLEELGDATNNFDQSTFLGEGSIGKLYKGRLENGTYVAIRSLTLFKKYSIQNLKQRLDLLSKLRHPHLVSLLGHCIDGGVQDSTANRVFLIHEYMPNGNFRTHLSENCPDKVLKWSDRLAVLIGVAKAVHFLHTGVIPASFSNRLKTNNILLDEHRIAKLSDYGMSIITEESEKLEAKGDGPKSWHMTKLADDVYNFGFVLLESLVGPSVSGKGEAFLLNEMTSFGSQDGRQRIVDPIVLTTSSQESLSIVISITNKCILPESSSRPSFEDVLWNLQYAAQVQATADADQKSDSTSRS
ncbi:probable inactive leucine-rich repeat receptor-like protein kinase At3g03770 isoform X2 [Cornus florida]|uniref:probable inactive leucine-rich repeat receptor-like protein kinase At3g03770 isoform X2 n=1 Tax=Cornus florida TaxID=4283 RepID=UPI0028A14F66|nr:probable inactive leucine-rich repeat receptor-like protein kinase At3g03770 isoform X2 [Cornus florida]